MKLSTLSVGLRLSASFGAILLITALNVAHRQPAKCQ